MKGIEVWKNPGNNFCIIKLHYTADPDKRGKLWKKRAKTGMTEEAWEQEYEINFERHRGKKVFPEFNHADNVRELSFNKGLVIHRGWDFGYHHPCCVLTQIDTEDRWLWIKGWIGSDENLEAFVNRIKPDFPKSDKKSNVIYKDYCDPAGNQSSDKRERTSIEILNAMGIYPKFKKSGPEDRARLMRSKLLLRKDGKAGLVVNSEFKIAIEGFSGGYHYPEATQRKPAESENPFKDGFYDHLFDAAGYIAINLLFYKDTDRDIKFWTPRIKRHYNPFTGT